MVARSAAAHNLEARPSPNSRTGGGGGSPPAIPSASTYSLLKTAAGQRGVWDAERPAARRVSNSAHQAAASTPCSPTTTVPRRGRPRLPTLAGSWTTGSGNASPPPGNPTIPPPRSRSTCGSPPQRCRTRTRTPTAPPCGTSRPAAAPPAMPPSTRRSVSTWPPCATNTGDGRHSSPCSTRPNSRSQPCRTPSRPTDIP
jgi:hypothetical protein